MNILTKKLGLIIFVSFQFFVLLFSKSQKLLNIHTIANINQNDSDTISNIFVMLCLILILIKLISLLSSVQEWVAAHITI